MTFHWMTTEFLKFPASLDELKLEIVFFNEDET